METSCGCSSLPALLWCLLFWPHRCSDQAADPCGLQANEEAFSQYSALPDSVWLHQTLHTVLVLGSTGQSLVPVLSIAHPAHWLTATAVIIVHTHCYTIWTFLVTNELFFSSCRTQIFCCKCPSCWIDGLCKSSKTKLKLNVTFMFSHTAIYL